MTDTLLIDLRLLAHPLTGLAGLTPDERSTLISAAGRLFALQETVAALRARVAELDRQLDRALVGGI